MTDALDNLTGAKPQPSSDLNLLSLFGPTAPADSVNQQFPSIPRKSGSYYHKVYSDFGEYTGITSVVTLGQPNEDPARTKDSKPLDGFCTYLGGNTTKGHEVDAGLTWSPTRDKNGHVDYTHEAWRPFWRTDKWHNAPAQPNFEWKPGDQVQMSLNMVAPGKLELTISDLGSHPTHVFKTDFDAAGFSDQYRRFFKRVDSLDQVGTEGHQVLPTKSHVDFTDWHSVNLVGADGSFTPLAGQHARVIDEPVTHVHTLKTPAESASGGEHVSISGR